MSKKALEPRVNMTIRLAKSSHKAFEELCRENHRGASEQVSYWIAQAKKATTLIVITAACWSCSLTSQEIEYSVEPGLAPYVDAFYADAEANGVHLDRGNLIVRYDATASDVGGISSEMGSQRTVRINQKYQGHPDLKWIVYHELGHALLYRKHTTGDASIMSPAVWNNGNLSKGLINELFTKQILL